MQLTELQKQILMYIHEHPCNEDGIATRFPELGKKYDPPWYDVIDPMLKARLIDTGAPGDPAAVWTLTNSGIIVVETEKKAKAERKKETRRFWIPFVVSNLMAFAALVISIIALLK